MARVGPSRTGQGRPFSDAGDGVDREIGGLVITPFALPDGCVGAYYPEANPLVPLWHHDQRSKTPASKAVPVLIRVTLGQPERT